MGTAGKKAYQLQLKKGRTFADVLDDIEGMIVAYMQNRRGIDEMSMRKLIDVDPEVRASYMRKINRTIDVLIHRGADPASLGRTA